LVVQHDDSDPIEFGLHSVARIFASAVLWSWKIEGVDGAEGGLDTRGVVRDMVLWSGYVEVVGGGSESEREKEVNIRQIMHRA
jgi:hypothetical protein